MNAGNAMTIYYCHECARKEAHVLPVIPISGHGPANMYQLEKYIKHTAPTGVYSLNSVFNDPTWPIYQNYLVAGAASGCLQAETGGQFPRNVHPGPRKAAGAD
jgi:hypothetical protein